AWLQYALLVLLPASVWLGARLLGLGPIGAGLASLLLLAPSEGGDLGRYGLGYGAFTWRGSGLYTELVALHLLLPALGVAARALVTHSRWEDATKWDSYAPAVTLRDLWSGRMLDAGRPRVLSLLLLVSAAVACALAWRDATARRLAALTALWLGLYLGRETW